MKFFKISASKVNVNENEVAHLWAVEFGEPASNGQIIEEVNAHLKAELGSSLPTGGVLLLTGRISVPLAFTIAHLVAHMYSSVGVFDPKESCYVIAVSHSPLRVGTTLKVV